MTENSVIGNKFYDHMETVMDGYIKNGLDVLSADKIYFQVIKYLHDEGLVDKDIFYREIECTPEYLKKNGITVIQMNKVGKQVEELHKTIEDILGE